MAFDTSLPRAQVFQVESDSNGSVYEVRIRAATGKHECSCTGFATKRNKYGGYSAIGIKDTYCKHIKNVLAGRHGAVRDIPSAPDPVDLQLAKARAIELRKQMKA